MSAYISRFNPYTMDDETILAVATGRKQPLQMVLDELEEMLLGNGQTSHLLVAGPRGIGKSFFARYLQIMFKRTEAFDNCKFILFPEEQSNIQFPSDLVRMLMSQLEEGGKFEQVFTRWEESEADWRESYARLKAYIEAQRAQHSQFLLVALVENMDELVHRFSGTAEGRFREMLERLPCFVLIGATPKPDFDRDYNKPLFHAFKKYKLNRWKEEDFLTYFTRRRLFEEARTGVKYSPERISLMENKLRAISLFTGGSPRMAAVLSNLLLRDDLFSTANTLRGLIDELTPYYQDLIKSIPPQSRKLFDTLIRAGENLSQTELAAKLGTSQNAISKAFGWLQENDYIRGEKREGANSFRYLVNDRVFSLYYKTREVYHDQDYSPIWLLADLLVAIYEEDELRQKVLRHLEDRFDMDTKELARVSMVARGFPRDLVPTEGDMDFWKGVLKTTNHSIAALEIVKPILLKIRDLENMENEVDALLRIKPLLMEVSKYLKKQEFGVEVASELEKTALLFFDKKWANTSIEILVHTRLFWKMFGNNELEAFNHFLYGICLTVVNNHEAALESLTKAMGLYNEVKEGVAVNYALKGMAFTNLGKPKKAFDIHLKVMESLEKQGLSNKPWSLGLIGWNLGTLGRHDEAINVFNQALDMQKAADNLVEQAWILGQVGWNLQKLGRNEASLASHKKAFEIWGDFEELSEQAWNLGRIGVCYRKLGLHQEAINAHLRAAEIQELSGNLSLQAYNLGQVGRNLNKLGLHTDSISFHQQALALREKEGNKPAQAWNLGHIGSNFLLLNQMTEAWNLLQDSILPKEAVFKQFGDAIIFKEKKLEQAAAFAIARTLINNLHLSSHRLDVLLCITHFFAKLLERKISHALFRDICEEALTIFPTPAHQTIILATLSTLEYLNAGKQKSYLEKLPPDTAVIVEAIVSEGSCEKNQGMTNHLTT